MTKLKNSNCYKTQNSKIYNSKTQIVTKPNNLYCDKSKKSNGDKTKQISNCDQTQRLEFLQNSKTKICTNLKNLKFHVVTILKISNGKTQKLKLWQNSNTQIVTKLKNKNCDKTPNPIIDKTQFLLGKKNLTPRQLMRCTQGCLLRSCDVLFSKGMDNEAFVEILIQS